MTTTTNLAITLVEQSQAQKEVTVNAALTRIDALMNTAALSRTTATPPGSPSAGDLYIVGDSATGAWSSQDGNIAYYDQTWKFITANEGMQLYVADEDVFYVYVGADWLSQAIHVYDALTGTSHTLDSSYIAKSVVFSNGSAITFTLPNDLYVGFTCRVVQSGAGQVTFSAASGAGLSNRSSHSKTAGQWAVCMLEVISNSDGSSAQYILSGDTAA